MAGETKICPNCDQEIGASEETCPKCKVVLADLESEMEVVERAQKALANKKKREAPPEPPPPGPTGKKKSGGSIFRSLGRK